MYKIKYLFFFSILSLLFTSCKPKAGIPVAGQSSGPELSKEETSIITNMEITSWEFAKTKQLDKLKELLADDYQAFFGKIIMNKTEVLQSFQKTNINAYRLSNIRVKKLADNAAVIYYEALQDAIDPGGDSWVPQIAASNVYIKRAGTWYPVFYHETALTR